MCGGDLRVGPNEPLLLVSHADFGHSERSASASSFSSSPSPQPNAHSPARAASAQSGGAIGGVPGGQHQHPLNDDWNTWSDQWILTGLNDRPDFQAIAPRRPLAMRQHPNLLPEVYYMLYFSESIFESKCRNSSYNFNAYFVSVIHNILAYNEAIKLNTEQVE